MGLRMACPRNGLNGLGIGGPDSVRTRVKEGVAQVGGKNNQRVQGPWSKILETVLGDTKNK
jgi:hypothetical protein